VHGLGVVSIVGATVIVFEAAVRRIAGMSWYYVVQCDNCAVSQPRRLIFSKTIRWLCIGMSFECMSVDEELNRLTDLSPQVPKCSHPNPLYLAFSGVHIMSESGGMYCGTSSIP
jgi:hypothetical protein